MTTFEDSFSEEIWRVTYKDYKDTTVDDTLLRVATAVASVEETDEKRAEWAAKFYDMLSDFKVTVGGRIYANAGTEWGGTTLMNCFVGPIAGHDFDSLEGIYKVLLDQAKTLKSEGGWGFNFSFIRPRGSFIGGIGVESPGAVRFMELFDKSSEIITSGSGEASKNKKAKGKIRKGAMMGVINVSHPDVIEFATAKQTPGRLTKFNVSVNCSDEFMEKVLKVNALKEMGADQAVIDDADKWDLIFPDTTFPQYKKEWDGNIKQWVEKGYPVKVYKTVSATWVWNLIMESTYNRAEPGVLFLDRANYFNPLNYKEIIQATNPCGEQTLAPGQVCNLASLNLTQMVKNDGTGFDLEKIKKYISYMVRFLDNTNILSKAPLDEYNYSMENKRRIGCGVLGWGSALFMLKVRFGSSQANAIREELMRTIAHTAYEASVDLAIEKGMFTECEPEKHAASPFLKQIGLPESTLERIRQFGIRNSALLSCQPTGNTSIFANVVSGGIEPVFMPEYIRTVIVSHVPDHIKSFTPKYWEGQMHETALFKWTKEGDEDILRGVDENGTVWKIDRNRGLTKEVLCEDQGVRWLKSRGEWDASADWAVTATQLSVQEHVDDLKGFAKYIDSAISKTINIPYEYPLDKFKDVYLDAYKTGYIKGLTTYRMGTMTTVLSAKEEKNAEASDEEIILDDVKLPSSSPAMVKKIKAEGKKWYLTVILDEEQKRPFALFVTTNNVEKNVSTEDAIEKLIALARTKGIPERHIVDTEHKMNTDTNAVKIARAISLLLRHGVLIKNIVRVLDTVEVTVGSFIFQIKKFLGQYIKDGEKVEGAKCENCGSPNVVYSEGCYKCNDCGSSKCG